MLEEKNLKTERDVREELSREIEAYAKTHDTEDNNMGIYTPIELEDAFNDGRLDAAIYWIRVY